MASDDAASLLTSSGSIVAFRSDVEAFAAEPALLEYGYWWEFQARRQAAGLTYIEIPIKHHARRAGETRIYLGLKVFDIGIRHVLGLLRLRKQLKHPRNKG